MIPKMLLILVIILILVSLYFIFIEYKYNFHVKTAKEGDWVKFYINKSKHYGCITYIYNGELQLEYIDSETGETKYYYCSINKTYPI